MTAAACPVTFCLVASKGTANTTPPRAYKRWPLGTYRAALPPSNECGSFAGLQGLDDDSRVIPPRRPIGRLRDGEEQAVPAREDLRPICLFAILHGGELFRRAAVEPTSEYAFASLATDDAGRVPCHPEHVVRRADRDRRGGATHHTHPLNRPVREAVHGEGATIGRKRGLSEVRRNDPRVGFGQIAQHRLAVAVVHQTCAVGRYRHLVPADRSQVGDLNGKPCDVRERRRRLEIPDRHRHDDRQKPCERAGEQQWSDSGALGHTRRDIVPIDARRERRHLGDHIAHGRRIRHTPRAVPVETPHQQCADSGRQRRRQCRPVRRALQHTGERVGEVLALEGTPARQHFVEHAAERPHVAALVGRASLRLLRRHVARRAEQRADAGHHRRRSDRRRLREVRASVGAGLGRPRQLRQAEVEHLDHAVGRDLDVGGFQVAVDDAVLVRRFKRLRNLSGDRQRLVERAARRARSDRRASSPSTSLRGRARGRRRCPRARRSPRYADG